MTIKGAQGNTTQTEHREKIECAELCALVWINVAHLRHSRKMNDILHTPMTGGDDDVRHSNGQSEGK